MSSLKELQNAFKQNVLTGNDAFGKYINSTEAVSSDVRLAIYSNAYYSRLEEALESDYGILKQLLGDDVFEEACLAIFTNTHPTIIHYVGLVRISLSFWVICLKRANTTGPLKWRSWNGILLVLLMRQMRLQ